MNPLASLSGWVQGHKPVAVGGAVAAVGAFALYQRHQSGGSASTGDSTAPAGAAQSGSTADPATAGLDGLPDTSATDIENSVQDQLNSTLQSINDALSNPTPVTTTATATAPPALPSAGKATHKISSGDTLTKISQEFFGRVDANTLHALRVANPILAYFGSTASLGAFAGDLMKIPGTPAPVKKPVAKKKAPVAKKPAPKKPVKKKHT